MADKSERPLDGERTGRFGHIEFFLINPALELVSGPLVAPDLRVEPVGGGEHCGLFLENES